MERADESRPARDPIADDGLTTALATRIERSASVERPVQLGRGHRGRGRGTSYAREPAPVSDRSRIAQFKEEMRESNKTILMQMDERERARRHAEWLEAASCAKRHTETTRVVVVSHATPSTVATAVPATATATTHPESREPPQSQSQTQTQSQLPPQPQSQPRSQTDPGAGDSPAVRPVAPSLPTGRVPSDPEGVTMKEIKLPVMVANIATPADQGRKRALSVSSGPATPKTEIRRREDGIPAPRRAGVWDGVAKSVTENVERIWGNLVSRDIHVDMMWIHVQTIIDLAIRHYTVTDLEIMGPKKTAAAACRTMRFAMEHESFREAAHAAIVGVRERLVAAVLRGARKIVVRAQDVCPAPPLDTHLARASDMHHVHVAMTLLAAHFEAIGWRMCDPGDSGIEDSFTIDVRASMEGTGERYATKAMEWAETVSKAPT